MRAIVILAAAFSSALEQRPAAPISDFGQIGTGPDTVLILPCMSCRWNAWETFMRMHGDRFTFFAVTPPGFGGTRAPALTASGDADTPWRRNLLDALAAFITEHRIRRAIILGHSWGTMVAVQLAARQPAVTRGVVAVDGSLESTTWLPADHAARIAGAAGLRASNAPLETNADAWSAFNRFQLPPDSAIARSVARDFMLLHGYFTATSRDALFGYWRENFLVDITSLTKSLGKPILDVRALWPSYDADSIKAAHRKSLAAAGISTAVQTLFMENSVHHVMLHRPRELGALVEQFAKGLPK